MFGIHFARRKSKRRSIAKGRLVGTGIDPHGHRFYVRSLKGKKYFSPF